MLHNLYYFILCSVLTLKIFPDHLSLKIIESKKQRAQTFKQHMSFSNLRRITLPKTLVTVLSISHPTPLKIWIWIDFLFLVKITAFLVFYEKNLAITTTEGQSHSTYSITWSRRNVWQGIQFGPVCNLFEGYLSVFLVFKWFGFRFGMR